MGKCQKSNTVEDEHIKTSTFCHSRHPSYNPRIKKNIERTATIARCTIWKDFHDLATPAIIIKGSNLIAHRHWLLQSHKHPKMPPAITIATLLLITNSVSSGVTTCLGRVLCFCRTVAQTPRMKLARTESATWWLPLFPAHSCPLGGAMPDHQKDKICTLHEHSQFLERNELWSYRICTFINSRSYVSE